MLDATIEQDPILRFLMDSCVPCSRLHFTVFDITQPNTMTNVSKSVHIVNQSLATRWLFSLGLMPCTNQKA